jgi:hypothetical protein
MFWNKMIRSKSWEVLLEPIAKTTKEPRHDDWYAFLDA